jgi:hypothetical protein
MAVIHVSVFARIMDKVVLKSIGIFAPSFVPSTGEVRTERQAIERLAYQTASITAHLLILWPILLTTFVSLVEGIAWVMGYKSPRWVPYIWLLSEIFMGNSLFSYFKDVPKMVLQLDELRDNDLLQSTEQFFRGPGGQRYVTTLDALTKPTYLPDMALSRILGYDRYDFEIPLNVALERQIRFALLSKPFTKTKRLLNLGLDSTAAFVTFIADRSSNITCANRDKFWAQCGPLMRFGVPVGFPILTFMTSVMREWWSAIKVAKEGSGAGWAPLMCRRGLQRKAFHLWRLQKRDWTGVWMYEYQMQKGRLLWGCPWKPNLQQMEAWMRQT